MKSLIEPIFNFVISVPIPVEESILVMPDTSKARYDIFLEVIAVGPDVRFLKEGNRALIPNAQYGIHEFDYDILDEDGNKIKGHYVVCREEFFCGKRVSTDRNSSED